jgi:hypothetical protein
VIGKDGAVGIKQLYRHVIGKDGAAGVKQLLPRVIGIGMALM